MKKYSILIHISLLLVVLVSACKVGKNYQRPEVKLPQKFSEVSFADTSSIADLQWEGFFADTTLQNLLKKGIDNNNDLQIAIKRIDIAEQQLKQARLLLLPDVNLQVGAQYNRPSDNSLSGLSTSSFLGTNHIENYNANLNLSWEIDIWGKIRRQKEGVLAEYLQTTEAKKAVQTQLVSEISQGYYNLLMLDRQLAIARRNIILSDSTLQLTKLLKDAGEVTQLAVEQAEAQNQGTSLLVPQLEQAIVQQENALQLLTGNLPSRVARNADQAPSMTFTNLSAGIPAAILSRRPDIRANEMALVAANAYAGMAQGNMYPSIIIGGAGGLESFKGSNWFSIPNSLFGVASGAIIQPVFRRRVLKTQFEIAKIQREQAVLRFRQSLLTAVAEVSNALIRLDKIDQQEKIASRRAENLRRSIANARLLFKSDRANYLEVITAQSNALQAELDLASIRRQQEGARVELYRALGGGWK